MGSINPLLDCGGSLTKTGITVGEDLLRCAKLDILPMPKTCRVFGLLDDPDLLSVLRLRDEDGAVVPGDLDEIAKSESPRDGLREFLNLP